MISVQDVALVISSLSDVVLVWYTVSRVRSKQLKELIKDEVKHFIESHEFEKKLTEAMDNSNVSKKLNVLVLILCTTMPELKDTKLCTGELDG